LTHGILNFIIKQLTDFSLFQNIQTGSGAHPAAYSGGNRVLTMVKVAGNLINHSPPFSAKVMHAWTYTSTPRVCVHGIDRENFTFYTAKITPQLQKKSHFSREGYSRRKTSNNIQLNKCILTTGKKIIT
jgi:hypothetical protein